MAGFLDDFGGVQQPLGFPGLGAMANWGMAPTSGGYGGPLINTGVGQISPVAQGGGLFGGILGGGSGLDKAQLGLTGLNTIGNLWAAFQAQKLAKQQFKYTKQVTDTNLANQIKTYNTGLTDRANNRQIVEGRTADQTKSYIDENSLARYGK